MSPVFWKLILQAFESPLLASMGSIAYGRELAKAAGHDFLQYGSVNDNSGRFTKLAFAEASFVQRPVAGMRFDL